MRRAAALVAAAALTGCGGPVELDGPTFRDSFSDPRSGFPVGPRIGYEDGELRLEAVRPREVVYAALPSMEQDVRNMVVAADVRVADADVAGAGVTCRNGKDFASPELYAFVVTADGIAQLLRADRRGLRPLASGRVPGGAAAVARGVRLEARCLRRELTLLVDGEQVLTTKDSGVRDGRAGVILLAGDDATPQARIDDLVVRTAAS